MMFLQGNLFCSFATTGTDVDWMYLWDLALRKDCMGYIKYILKSSLMKLPVFGWAFHILEFIPVERKWEVDEANMRQMLSKFKDPRDPLCLVLFPEGTNFIAQKCLRSQKYATENGLPILKNLLLPKSKGFNACLEDLRSTLDAVYDVTIGYKHRCPSFLDNVFGVDPSEVHIHVRRITLDDIPMSEREVTAWLMDTFQHKDQLLSNFMSEGYFPPHGTEANLSAFKCLVNVMLVLILTSGCTFLTFFSSIWFKIVVSLSCSYMVSATYFNIRPSIEKCLPGNFILYGCQHLLNMEVRVGRLNSLCHAVMCNTIILQKKGHDRESILLKSPVRAIFRYPCTVSRMLGFNRTIS